MPNGDEITIAQLLGMRAGTYDFTMDAAFGRQFAANPLMKFGVRDVLSLIRRHKPSFRPGARVQYSDTNYTLVGFVAIANLSTNTSTQTIDLFVPIARRLYPGSIRPDADPLRKLQRVALPWASHGSRLELDSGGGELASQLGVAIRSASRSSDPPALSWRAAVA